MVRLREKATKISSGKKMWCSLGGPLPKFAHVRNLPVNELDSHIVYINKKK